MKNKNFNFTTTGLTNLVLNTLKAMGAPENLTFNDQFLTPMLLYKELNSRIGNGDFNQGFILYWEQDSDLIDLFSKDQWASNIAEDESDYQYLSILASVNDHPLVINFAIN